MGIEQGVDYMRKSSPASPKFNQFPTLISRVNCRCERGKETICLHAVQLPSNFLHFQLAERPVLDFKSCFSYVGVVQWTCGVLHSISLVLFAMYVNF